MSQSIWQANWSYHKCQRLHEFRLRLSLWVIGRVILWWRIWNAPALFVRWSCNVTCYAINALLIICLIVVRVVRGIRALIGTFITLSLWIIGPLAWSCGKFGTVTCHRHGWTFRLRVFIRYWGFDLILGTTL